MFGLNNVWRYQNTACERVCFKFASCRYYYNSPQANLSVFVPRGNAVIFRMTGDARDCVLASLLVVFFEGKPFNDPHNDRHAAL